MIPGRADQVAAAAPAKAPKVSPDTVAEPILNTDPSGLSLIGPYFVTLLGFGFAFCPADRVRQCCFESHNATLLDKRSLRTRKNGVRSLIIFLSCTMVPSSVFGDTICVLSQKHFEGLYRTK